MELFHYDRDRYCLDGAFGRVQSVDFGAVGRMKGESQQAALIKRRGKHYSISNVQKGFFRQYFVTGSEDEDRGHFDRR